MYRVLIQRHGFVRATSSPAASRIVSSSLSGKTCDIAG
jgi:hypothetical protein